jgi:predicted nucleic acid-binding protein
VIGADTSVLVRYLVGTPAGQAKRAAALIDDEALDVGVSVIALAECAHVLRTLYGIGQREIVDALIELVQRDNIRVVDDDSDLIVSMLVRARAMPGRPIPDALMVASMAAARALPIATFDHDQGRYGIAVREP